MTLVGAAWGCGPDFPNRYLDASEAQLLAAPEASFAHEIARIELPVTNVPRALPPLARSGAEQDVAELKQVLRERGLADRDQWPVAGPYEQNRRALDAWLAAHAHGGFALPSEPRPEEPPTELKLQPTPGVPLEFSRYFEGAVAWHRGDAGVARAAWQAVLALPAAERRHRALWAAFMLGRLALAEAETSPSGPGMHALTAEATRRFREVRAFVGEGHQDGQGLAAASLGWEARAALVGGDLHGALVLYLQHHASGDESAVESLRRTAARVLEASPEERARVAAFPAGRRVVTAYLIAKGRTAFEDEHADNANRARAWALGLEQAGVRGEPEADRLAWLAYEGGLFELAARWASLAPENAPAAQWIRAKLALRDGNLAGAAKRLQAAADSPELSLPHLRQVQAELGRVRLAQNDFAGAFTNWWRGGHWEDAAFVAERVMTLDELNALVRSAAVTNPSVLLNGPGPESVTGLAARRLARAGRYADASALFAEPQRTVYAGYLADVRAGFDRDGAAAGRAAAFWRAAQTLRAHGQELLGTELEPDWGVWGGSFDLGSLAEQRAGEARLAGGVLAPTPLELARLAEQTVPSRRFHYRYRAAELAWWAASLLPNDSDETAAILNEAGGWLKARDPQEAQRFYEALVIRCGRTALGRAAAERRWFPRAGDL